MQPLSGRTLLPTSQAATTNRFDLTLESILKESDTEEEDDPTDQTEEKDRQFLAQSPIRTKHANHLARDQSHDLNNATHEQTQNDHQQEHSSQDQDSDSTSESDESKDQFNLKRKLRMLDSESIPASLVASMANSPHAIKTHSVASEFNLQQHQQHQVATPDASFVPSHLQPPVQMAAPMRSPWPLPFLHSLSALSKSEQSQSSGTNSVHNVACLEDTAARRAFTRQLAEILNESDTDTDIESNSDDKDQRDQHKTSNNNNKRQSSNHLTVFDHHAQVESESRLPFSLSWSSKRLSASRERGTLQLSLSRRVSLQRAQSHTSQRSGVGDSAEASALNHLHLSTSRDQSSLARSDAGSSLAPSLGLAFGSQSSPPFDGSESVFLTSILRELQIARLACRAALDDSRRCAALLRNHLASGVEIALLRPHEPSASASASLSSESLDSNSNLAVFQCGHSLLYAASDLRSPPAPASCQECSPAISHLHSPSLHSPAAWRSQEESNWRSFSRPDSEQEEVEKALNAEPKSLEPMSMSNSDRTQRLFDNWRSKNSRPKPAAAFKRD